MVGCGGHPPLAASGCQVFLPGSCTDLHGRLSRASLAGFAWRWLGSAWCTVSCMQIHVL